MTYDGDNLDHAFRGFLAGLLVMAVIALVYLISVPYMSESEAIKRGAAYYHPQTANFTWAAGNVYLKTIEK